MTWTMAWTERRLLGTAGLRRRALIAEATIPFYRPGGTPFDGAPPLAVYGLTCYHPAIA
jgi:hypothetical protein